MTRKFTFLAGVAFAVSVLPVLAQAQAPATPGAPAAPAARKSKWIRGRIDTIDQSAKTFAVKGWGPNATSTTVGISKNTKYYIPVAETVSDLKLGDVITINGRGITAGDTSVDAGRIIIVPTGLNLGNGMAAKPGFSRNRVTGTITAVAPSLTIKADSDAAVTVNTTATTDVYKFGPGAWSDLAQTSFVSVGLNRSDDSPTAKQITIMPSFRRRN